MGSEEREPLTHTQPALRGWGGRTSGFHGLTTPRLHPSKWGEKGGGKRRRVGPRRRSCHRATTSSTLLPPGHLPVASWATGKQVTVGEGCPGSWLFQAAPLRARRPCGTWRGAPAHSHVLRLPTNSRLEPASLSPDLSSLCPLDWESRGSGPGRVCQQQRATLTLAPGLACSRAGERALASREGPQDQARTSRPVLSPTGIQVGHSPPSSSPQQSNTSSEDTNNINNVNLKKKGYIYFIYI